MHTLECIHIPILNRQNPVYITLAWCYSYCRMTHIVLNNCHISTWIRLALVDNRGQVKSLAPFSYKNDSLCCYRTKYWHVHNTEWHFFLKDPTIDQLNISHHLLTVPAHPYGFQFHWTLASLWNWYV